jgi:hypothetical protein
MKFHILVMACISVFVTGSFLRAESETEYENFEILDIMRGELELDLTKMTASDMTKLESDLDTMEESIRTTLQAFQSQVDDIRTKVDLELENRAKQE